MDVSADTFDAEVLQSSRELPVLVDFWAPWCGPCRSLGPILEKLAGEYAGRLKLAKVNLDEAQALAATYGVRSIPDVMAFRDGKPVSHFLGALPESQVRGFIERLMDGERLRLAERRVEEQRLDEAEALLAQVGPDAQLDARREALLAAVGFARAGGSETSLKQQLASKPDDHDARLQLARLYAGARRYREAMEELLAIVRKDRNWRDGEARRQIVSLFTLAAHDPDLVAEYRRKLATTLY
jgi:putative thioredoxin